MLNAVQQELDQKLVLYKLKYVPVHRETKIGNKEQLAEPGTSNRSQTPHLLQVVGSIRVVP